MSQQAKKRKKSYYINSAKKNCYRLDAGMKGFLLTCNNAEKRAVQEAYHILNEYADLLYGPEEASKADDASGDSDDFEAEIRKELESAKARKVSGARRFQVVETKTTNCVFIKTTLDHPNEILTKYLKDVMSTGDSKCRFILRFLPVLGTCNANVDKIEKLAEEVLAPFLQRPASSEDKLTYCTVYKVRNNNLSRDEILPAIGRVAVRLNPSIRVNFEQPDIVVSVDVLQKFCCLSVMTDFFQLRKYNVQEISKLRSVALPTCEGDVKVGQEEGVLKVESVGQEEGSVKVESVGQEEGIVKVESVGQEDPVLCSDTPVLGSKECSGRLERIAPVTNEASAVTDVTVEVTEKDISPAQAANCEGDSKSVQGSVPVRTDSVTEDNATVEPVRTGGSNVPDETNSVICDSSSLHAAVELFVFGQNITNL